MIHQLAALKIGEFPGAMESPLVVAGIYGTKSQRLYSVGTNMMHLRPLSGYDTIHAEEEAFGGLDGEAKLQTNEPVYIVVTLEPCRERKPKGEMPCCERIVKFAAQHPVEKVIIGVIETGRGLRYLLERGIKVVLLHGQGHKTAIREKLAEGGRGDPNPVIAGLLKMKSNLLQVREDALLDAINQEEHKRFLPAAQQRKVQSRVILEALKAACNEEDPFSQLSTLFPAILTPKVQPSFESKLAEMRRDPKGDLEELFALLIDSYVYRAWEKQRSQKIENELRQKESNDGR